MRPPIRQDTSQEPDAASADDGQGHVRWSDLPQKTQLAVIVFARLAEPISERSFTSYLFYQLRWFDPSLPESAIAAQAGILTAAFAAAQCLTAMCWGRMADSPRCGRKSVLLIGLLGSVVCSIGTGYSTSFAAAITFRILTGALNGNVGVLRTMVSEIVTDKRYRPRAFLLLPMCFNVGVIIGPLLGGFLADPVKSFPLLFGPGSKLGGTKGVRWMIQYPYALPTLVSGAILTIAAFAVLLGLDETHSSLRTRPDYGRKLGLLISRKFFTRSTHSYARLPMETDTELDPDLELEHGNSNFNDQQHESNESRQKDSQPSTSLRLFRDRKFMLTMTQHFLQALHVSAFNALLFVLLPSPHSDNRLARLPFLFNGGLGLSAQKVGLANTIIGLVGMPLQLVLYPYLTSKIGNLGAYRVFLPFSGVAYFTLPFLVLLPNQTLFLWPCLVLVLALHVCSRVFVNPATVILVNEAAPHPSLLGTTHGFGQTISSAARMLGPTAGGAALSWGLNSNCIGAPFWGMTVLVVLNWVLVLLLSKLDR